MKTGKQFKNDEHNNYNIIYGCVDNKNPKSIYVNISAWAEPINKDEEEVNYTRVIKDINKKLKQDLFNYFNLNEKSGFLKNNTIVDLDIRESGIKFGKRSFMSCEITLFQTEEISIISDKIKIYLNEVIYMLINKVFELDENFKYHKKKI
jgi:hypothetical protein